MFVVEILIYKDMYVEVGVVRLLLCVEQAGRNVLFLTERKISGSKNNTVIQRYSTASNMYFTSRNEKVL